MGCIFYIIKKCVFCIFLLSGKFWYLILIIGNILVKYFKLWNLKKNINYELLSIINVLIVYTLLCIWEWVIVCVFVGDVLVIELFGGRLGRR